MISASLAPGGSNLLTNLFDFQKHAPRWSEKESLTSSWWSDPIRALLFLIRSLLSQLTKANFWLQWISFLQSFYRSHFVGGVARKDDKRQALYSHKKKLNRYLLSKFCTQKANYKSKNPQSSLTRMQNNYMLGRKW